MFVAIVISLPQLRLLCIFLSCLHRGNCCCCYCRCIGVNSVCSGCCCNICEYFSFFLSCCFPFFSSIVTTPHIQGECTKVFRYPIEYKSAVTLLIYCCSTYWIQYCSDLPFNLISPSFSQFMDLSLGIKIFPHNKNKYLFLILTLLFS